MAPEREWLNADGQSVPPPPPAPYRPELMPERRAAAQPRVVSRQDLARRGQHPPHDTRGPGGPHGGPAAPRGGGGGPPGPGSAAAAGGKRKHSQSMQRIIDRNKKMRPGGR